MVSSSAVVGRLLNHSDIGIMSGLDDILTYHETLCMGLDTSTELPCREYAICLLPDFRKQHHVLMQKITRGPIWFKAGCQQ